MLKVPENNTHPIRTATVSFIIDFVRLHWILRMVNATTDITHPFFALALVMLQVTVVSEPSWYLDT